MIATAWSSMDTDLSLSVVILLVLSGFFAMAETSLVRMTKSRARSLKEKGKRGSKSLVSLAESPEKFLNPLLLLILVCQLVSATMVGVLASHLFGAAGLIVSTVGEVVVIFVIFEAIPKNFAVQHPDAAALTTAPVVAALLNFWPIKWVSRFLLAIAQGVIALFFGRRTGVNKMTEDEVLAMADVAHEDQAIEEGERNFIRSVIEFGDTIVREVMVPRIDMVDVSGESTVRVALDTAIETGRSRLPVLGEGVDDVVGIVNLRHLARLVVEGHGEDLVHEHMGAASFVPETKRVASLLTQIRQGQNHLYVVVDEYGGTAGLVTLEDILEELVGEITDESDQPQDEDVEVVEGTGLVVSGRLNIDDVNNEYDLDLPKDGWDTVGGLVLDLAGGVPAQGEVLEVASYVLTVVRMDGRRIEEVLIEKLESP
ncbi:MAG: HlyC/CorC family transporter [Acidobacteria bacterium]|nr:HlyC/CorC family transporter [Acidobacteriota bacterium]